MVKDGYKINHLLFMDDLKLFGKNEKELESLVQTVRIFSDDIGMKFGLDKCAVMTMKRGKKIHSDGINLPDGSQLRGLGEEGILVCLSRMIFFIRSGRRSLGVSISEGLKNV